MAIAVNDKTRPVPHHHLLPPLLRRLADLGVPDDAITFHLAVGAHPPMERVEFSAVLPPEIVRRYEVVSHDAERAEDLVHLGTTARRYAGVGERAGTSRPTGGSWSARSNPTSSSGSPAVSRAQRSASPGG